MKAKKLIVHIGLAKTGTTALQNNFHANRDLLLARDGILYPSDGPNHFHFQSAVSDAPETLIQIRREGITDAQEAKARAEDFIRKFETEIQQHSPQTILISSEYFTSMSEAELQRFATRLSTYAEEVWAIAYMRDPWSFSASMMQQFIRDGRFGAPLRFGYCSGQVEALQAAGAAFGGRLIVRPYFGGETGRTNILADFCDAIGIDPIKELPVGAASVNQSIGHLRMTLIAELNRSWPQIDKDNNYCHSPSRDAALQWILDLPINDRPVTLTRRQVDVISANAKDDIDLVEKCYFDGQPVFSNYIAVESPPEVDHTISLDTLGEADLREITRATIEGLARGKPTAA